MRCDPLFLARMRMHRFRARRGQDPNPRLGLGPPAEGPGVRLGLGESAGSESESGRGITQPRVVLGTVTVASWWQGVALCPRPPGPAGRPFRA